MKATRKPGGHIGAICTALNTFGPMNVRALTEFFPHVSRPNLHKYCTRAVIKGLLTSQTSPCKYGATNIYTVDPHWRILAEIRGSKAQPQTNQSRWQGVNSVFSMGAI